MALPTKMTSHMLDALKGWPNPHALDFQAKLSSNVTIDPFYAGRVVHLNASGEFETGVGTGDMPLFLFQSSNDPDVDNYGGDPSTDSDLPWVPVAPTGVMGALVATGGYELWSTEYKSDETYHPNDKLTATVANTTLATGGVLKPGTLGTNCICGIVSRGVISRHNKSVLAFWPTFLPVYP